MNFILRFLLNLSNNPLPAEELNELYAAFLTEFVCRLRSRRRFMSNFISKVLSVSLSSLEDRY